MPRTLLTIGSKAEYESAVLSKDLDVVVVEVRYDNIAMGVSCHIVGSRKLRAISAPGAKLGDDLAGSWMENEDRGTLSKSFHGGGSRVMTDLVVNHNDLP